MKNKLTIFLLLLASIFSKATAQDEPSLLDAIGEPTAEKSFAIATFKGTRLINFHTLEVPGKRSLDFRIAHRFSTFNDGGYNFWGLDGPANIRLSFEYSYDGRLNVGIGRSNLDKIYDAFAKYRLIRQGENGGAPVSVTLFSSGYFTAVNDANDGQPDVDKYAKFKHRVSNCHQVMVGRKFNDDFSLQIAPTLVHVNLAENLGDKNDAFIIATAVRYKVTRRMAITAEYGWRVNDYSSTEYYDSFGIGIDIETGGHVFQMHFTNSAGLTENQFYTRTTDSWGDKGFRLGFNVSRVFTL
ncbi:MAG: DUF5777 family beta-barrel protein [Saprospiraceae bacterium]|jgi:hypothetical protein|nr:DUF5777 family beta-barrel protein [Saprospiraceae bacterium]